MRDVFGSQYVAFLGEHSGGEASLKGWGFGFAILIGGTPFPGLVIGGTFGFAGTSGEFKGAPVGAEGEGHAIAPVLGPFVDWYPNPKGGWHVGSSFGLGGFSGADAADNKYVGYAPAAAVFGGYDAWIGPQSSIGFGLVFQAAPRADARNNAVGYRFAALSAGLQVSFLYH